MNIYLLNAMLLIITIFLMSDSKRVLVLKMRSKSWKSHMNVFIFVTFWIVLLTLEYGLRGDISTDYSTYKLWFEIAKRNSYGDIISSYGIEAGFHFLNKIISVISDNYVTMTLVSGIIAVALYLISVSKNSELVWASILVYVGLGIFYNSFNLVSQTMAAAIFTFALKYIFESSFFKYILICIAAAMFHKSAIVMIPLYFVFHVKISKKNLKTLGIVIVALSVIVFFNLRPIVNFFGRFLYSSYLDYSYEQMTSGVTLSYIFKNIFVCMPLVCLYKRFDFRDIKDRTVYFGNVLYLLVIILSYNIKMIQRISFYLVIFVMLGYGIILNREINDKNLKKIGFMLFFTLLQVGWIGSEYYFFFQGN